MHEILRKFLMSLTLSFFALNPILGQNQDWRNAINGNPIYSNGYCDQPYIIILEDAKWLCVFTTNQRNEGSKGQHTVSSISDDIGKT
ncbi:hypothetical protein ACWGOQ_0018630 [Aquimarina sp. M1]